MLTHLLVIPQQLALYLDDLNKMQESSNVFKQVESMRAAQSHEKALKENLND